MFLGLDVLGEFGFVRACVICLLRVLLADWFLVGLCGVVLGLDCGFGFGAAACLRCFCLWGFDWLFLWCLLIRCLILLLGGGRLVFGGLLFICFVCLGLLEFAWLLL